MLTDREPDVNVSLYGGVIATENSLGYSVLDGQIFGLDCRTESQFSVNWYDANGVKGQCGIYMTILHPFISSNSSKCHTILVCCSARSSE